MPLLFGPVHIAFLEMIIDPVCSLVFEAETEEDESCAGRRATRPSRCFPSPMMLWGLFQGAFALALVAAVYVVTLRRGMPPDEVRALAFFSLVIAMVALILVNRSTSASLFKAVLRPNPALAITIPLVAAMLAGSLLWPDLRELFRFGPLHADDLSLSLGVGLLVLIAMEGLKSARRVWVQKKS